MQKEKPLPFLSELVPKNSKVILKLSGGMQLVLPSRGEATTPFYLDSERLREMYSDRNVRLRFSEKFVLEFQKYANGGSIVVRDHDRLFTDDALNVANDPAKKIFREPIRYNTVTVLPRFVYLGKFTSEPKWNERPFPDISYECIDRETEDYLSKNAHFDALYFDFTDWTSDFSRLKEKLDQIQGNILKSSSIIGFAFYTPEQPKHVLLDEELTNYSYICVHSTMTPSTDFLGLFLVTRVYLLYTHMSNLCCIK